MICVGCKRDEELRLGFCFDCATVGEAKAAKRIVLQHIFQGVRNVCFGSWSNARIDFCWAWERLTQTGDYQPGGTFEREYDVK